MRVGQYGRTAATLGVVAATLAVLPVRVAPIPGQGVSSFAVAIAVADEARGGGDRGRGNEGRSGGGRGGENGKGGNDRGGSDRGHSDEDDGEGKEGLSGNGRGEGSRRGGNETPGAGANGKAGAAGREQGNESRGGGVETGASARSVEGKGRPSGGVSGEAGSNAPASQGSLPAEAGGEEARPLKAVRVERDDEGMRILYSNRILERIVAGRYEMENAEGVVVVSRQATPEDIGRVKENVGRSGLPTPSGTAVPAGSGVESMSVTADEVTIRYREGWAESLAAGRYRLEDPDGNIVVERPATAQDQGRLAAIAGG